MATSVAPQPSPSFNDDSRTQPKAVPRSTLVSRNVTISGRRTSIRLEPEMWDGLREICRRERSNMHQICTSIASQKLDQTSLTAAIRVFAMRYFRVAATEDGHAKAGHGYGLMVAVGINSTYPRHDAGAMMQLHKRSFG